MPSRGFRNGSGFKVLGYRADLLLPESGAQTRPNLRQTVVPGIFLMISAQDLFLCMEKSYEILFGLPHSFLVPQPRCAPTP